MQRGVFIFNLYSIFFYVSSNSLISGDVSFLMEVPSYVAPPYLMIPMVVVCTAAFFFFLVKTSSLEGPLDRESSKCNRSSSTIYYTNA